MKQDILDAVRRMRLLTSSYRLVRWTRLWSPRIARGQRCVDNAIGLLLGNKGLFTLLLVGLWGTIQAQNRPVTSTLQLLPPHSVYLADYARPGSEQMQVYLLLRDLSEAQYEVRLRLTIEGAGIRLQTDPNYIPPPIVLEGGSPTIVSGEDLAPYLNSRNLVFSGITQAQYEQRRALPEGFYQFSVEVLDYRRADRALSRPATFMAWFTLNEPPRLTAPICGTTLPLQEPTNILFQWMDGGNVNPGSPLATEYELTLVEVFPQERNVEDAIRSSVPLLQTITTETSYLYGITDAALIPGQKYAFRVRALDVDGRGIFKNEGYSQTCHFTYGDGVVVTPPDGIRMYAQSARKALVNWHLSIEPDAYRVEYRRQADQDKQDNEDDQDEELAWFGVETTEEQVVLRDLEPETTYEVRVASLFSSYVSRYSLVQTFTTPEVIVAACGAAPPPPVTASTVPLTTAMAGQYWQVGDFEMQVREVRGGDGVFSGWGVMSVPYLGLQIPVKFEGVWVDEDYNLVQGEVIALSEGVEGFQQRWKEEHPEEEKEDESDELVADGEQSSDNGPGDEAEVSSVTVEGEVTEVYVNEQGQVVAVDSEGNEEVVAEQVPQGGEVLAVEDSQSNSFTVSSEGQVSQGGNGVGNTGKIATDQPDQREKLIAEILHYLEQTITAWQDDNMASLPECLPANNDLLNPVAEQINNYLGKPGDLLPKFSLEDQSTLSSHVSTYNNVGDLVSYQEVVSEDDWQRITCRTYNYLNDLAQGVGEVAEASVAKAKLEDFISKYRTAYQQGSTSFTLSSANFGDVYSIDYFIRGVSPIKVGLVDKRESGDYEPSLSLGYALENVVGKQQIAGTIFESSAVFRFGKPGWSFMDGPKFLLYGHHAEVANGLDSKTLLEDYLPGKYDYEAVHGFIDMIINSHDKGEESLNTKGKLKGQQVYGRNVDFGDKGMYDLYITRTGDFKKDHNSFYNYTKTEVLEVFGFTGSYTEYKFYCKSGGVTYLVVPRGQAAAFESSVLKLHSVSSGTAHIDLVNAIRAANLNADTKLDITEYGSKGGLSPVFEINHDEEKLKLMVAYPLLGKKKNKINPSKRPESIAGQIDNAMGKAGSWVVYEFDNSKGTGKGHNTKVYVKAAQMELFESYLLIAREVLITGINWRSQSDSYFSTFSCYGPPNQCCYQASKAITEQFGVSTDRSHSIDVAVLTNPATDYNSLSVTADFDTGLEYLKSAIKPNKRGGKPVVVGVHYAKNTAPYNANEATYHFVIVVGKGYDREKRKYYFRFYDVGKSNGTNPFFRLYIDEQKREIAGYSEDRFYTVTEVRRNY